MGWHGQGKTYNAVAHVLDQHDRHGIPIVSNATIRGAVESTEWLRVGEAPVPPVLRFETWDELMALLEAAIARRLRLQLLVDEAGKFLSSRFFTKLDPRVLMVLQERRKIGAGLDLYWTAPHFDHVDKILRDVTQAVHVCKRLGGSEYSHDGGRRPRVFYVRTYRPTEVNKERKRAIARRLVPFAPELAELYTTGIVSMGAPMATATAARPDYREPSAEPAPPAVTVSLPQKSGRRLR